MKTLLHRFRPDAPVEIKVDRTKLFGTVVGVSEEYVCIGDLQFPPGRDVPSSLQSKMRKVRDLSKGGQAHPLVAECESAVEETAQLAVGTQYVVKLLRADADETARERFAREIEALRQVKHTNVIPVVAASEPRAADPWMILPLGESFADAWRTARAGFRADELFDLAWSYWIRLLNGLQEFHSQGWVHRDIKDGNIVLLNGEPVLIDFGLLYRPDDAEARLTQIAGRAIGNHLTRHPPAAYDRGEVWKPWYDCLCMTNLLAWMLAKEPLAALGHYHWRYHQFVEDERCVVVRTLMAITGDESTSPQSAEELVRLAKTYLTWTEPSTRCMPTFGDNNAVRMARQAKVKADLDRQARLQLARDATPVAAKFVGELIEILAAKLDALESAGLAVERYGLHPELVAKVPAKLELAASQGPHGLEHIASPSVRNAAGRALIIQLTVHFEAVDDDPSGSHLPFKFSLTMPVSSLPASAVKPGRSNPKPGKRAALMDWLRTDGTIEVGGKGLDAVDFYNQFLAPALDDELFWSEVP